jgi:hypothetical protein
VVQGARRGLEKEKEEERLVTEDKAMDMCKSRIGFVVLAILMTIGIVIALKSKKPIKSDQEAPPVGLYGSLKDHLSPCPESFTSLQHITSQLNRWHGELPGLTELITYGKTSNGTPCQMLRIGTKDKPKVLLASGLVGSEEYPVVANMHILHRLLSEYMKNPEVTWLLENRDIYFVPNLSPDTYGKTNMVEGLDPMTSFPSYKKLNQHSPSPVVLAMSLANTYKFKAVLNMHSSGEKLLPPENASETDGAAICALIDKMTGLNGYLTSRLEYNDGNGSDTDWFYTTGACSMTMYWGKGGSKTVCYKDVPDQVERNFRAICLFIKEAVEIELNPRPLKTVYYYQAD